MKKIFWIFTIRKRIKKRIITTIKEEDYLDGERIKGLHSGKPDIGNYLQSRIMMKKEVVDVLRSLL